MEDIAEQEVKGTKKSIKNCFGIDTSPLILVLSLSFHSLFEGIAVGLVDTQQVLINLIIGISIH